MAEPARTRGRRRAAALIVTALLLSVPGAAAAAGSTATTTATTTAAATTTTAAAKASTTPAAKASTTPATSPTTHVPAKSTAAKPAAGAAAAPAASNTAPAKAASTKAPTTKAPTTKPAKGAKHKAKKKPKPKPKPPITGWVASSGTFPSRAVVLLPPAHTTLSAAQIHLTENGAAVGQFALTPLSQAQPGDFGVQFVFDRSGAIGQPALNAAMSGAQTIAAQRAAAEQLGLITFASTPRVDLPLTSSAQQIGLQLAATAGTGGGEAPAAAAQLALARLTAAGVARGAIVVMTTAADAAGAVEAIGAQAAAAHVAVIAVAVGAGNPAAALKALAQNGPGNGAVVPTSVAQLPAVLTAVQADLSNGFVLHYRSGAPHSTPVAVGVTATGIPGTVAGSYQSPAPPAPVHKAVHRAAPTPQPSPSSQFSDSTLLSPTPSFAAPAPTPAPVAQPGNSFWSSPAAVTYVAVLVAMLLAIALALIVHRPTKNKLRARVGNFIPVEGAPSTLTATAARKPTGPLASLQRGSWWPPFVEAVEVARSPKTPTELVRRAAIAAALLAIVLTIVAGTVLIGLLPLIMWPFLLRTVMFRAANKQRAKFRDDLPTYLQDLASSIRVGRSFIGAVTAVAENADEPMRSELERVVTDEALGRPVEQCLDAVAARMASTDMGQVALIAGLNRKSGANIAESLDRVAEGARERADMIREMRALTAQAKMSSLVLTGLPACLLLALSLLSPSYAHPLLHTTIGLVALSFGAALVLAGWKVMSKITNVEAV